jgi:hypothetical protein
MLSIWISTCITSKLFGAPIEMMTMTEKLAYMLTIGKTTEENLLYLLTVLKCVIIGRLTLLLELMSMAVKLNTCAKALMAGKSKNIILTSLNLRSVNMVVIAQSHIVLTFTLSTISGLKPHLGFTIFLKVEHTAFTLIFTYLNMVAT